MAARIVDGDCVSVALIGLMAMAKPAQALNRNAMSEVRSSAFVNLLLKTGCADLLGR